MSQTPPLVRNPFGLIDVPEPFGPDVEHFAATLRFEPAPKALAMPSDGVWQSRWDGGVDQTMHDDTADAWKLGLAEVVSLRDCIYVLFDWNNGVQRALLEARGSGGRFIGRYINLNVPSIRQPWVGRMISADLILGVWPRGRLEFYK